MTRIPFNRARATVLFAAAVLIVAASCERKTLLDEVRVEYDAGRYREALFLVRHHFRRGGARTPPLLFAMGRSYLRLGIEAEAEDAFAEVYSIDSTYAPRIADELRTEAVRNLEEGNESRGRRFVVQAINYDRNLSFGRWDALAGELLIEQRDYEGAIPLLDRWLAERPDTVGAAEVMLNLGAAYEEAGKTDRAIEVYRGFIERFPLSRLQTTVRWKLENLLYDRAESLFRGGEPDGAERILADLAAAADNPLVRERANFLLGELYEERYDHEGAIRFYREVVNLNLGSSGRLVDRAKERIERIEMSRSKR